MSKWHSSLTELFLITWFGILTSVSLSDSVNSANTKREVSLNGNYWGRRVCPRKLCKLILNEFRLKLNQRKLAKGIANCNSNFDELMAAWNPKMTFVDFTAFSSQIRSHNLWKFVNYLFINEANVAAALHVGGMDVFNLIDCDLKSECLFVCVYECASSIPCHCSFQMIWYRIFDCK